jgi:TPP-dependent pyruvate/acetoin dehydrogenase alpha subunit
LQLQNDLQLRLFREMLRIRLVEERIAAKYPEQEMRCPIHLSDGQEGIAAGACSVLRKGDLIVSTHRSHGHYLAKGGGLKAMIAEIYGKAAGCVGGRGGSMHLLDDKAGVLACLPIVGTSIPLGVGAAFAAKTRGEDIVCAVFLGDAAIEEGVFYESANFASLHGLPVVFICEDNDLSFYTPLKDRQPDRPITDLAKAHNIPAWEVDGNDALAVFGAMSEIVERARGGKGPGFLLCNTRRWREHCGPRFDVELGQISEAEFKVLQENCPIGRLRKMLNEAGVLDKAIETEMTNKIGAEIDEAFAFAKAAPLPKAESAGDYLYAE